MISPELLRDEDFREETARAAYYRERAEEAALEREHEMSDDFAYFVIAWEDLSPFAQRPYRTAVAETCDTLVAVAEAA